MVENQSDSERRNPLPRNGLLFPISSQGSFIYINPQTGQHIPLRLLYQSWRIGCKRGCSRGDNLHNEENGSETENRGAGFVTDLLMIELKEVVAVFCLVSVFFQH